MPAIYADDNGDVGLFVVDDIDDANGRVSK